MGFCTAKKTATWRDNQKNGRKYLEMMRLIKNEHPEYKRSSGNSTTTKQAGEELGKGYIHMIVSIRRCFSKEEMQMVSRHLEKEVGDD